MTTDPICANNDLPVTKIFKFATLLVNSTFGWAWVIYLHRPYIRLDLEVTGLSFKFL